MANKPTFNSLTPEQVNDIIAIKVMGWQKTGVFWVDEFASMKAFIAPPDTDVRKSEFNPYHSLDDCWKAEEILLRDVQTGDALRKHMYGAFITTHTVETTDEGQRVTGVVEQYAVEAFHISAKHRCEAMLRAIGEVE